jgi:UDP-glucuronate 4-epimerase
MRFLLTGTAGFIGFHLARRLLADGHAVTGIDGITPYYDQALKRARLARLADSAQFTAHELMLEQAGPLADIVAAAAPEIVVHLAAQAGVRYSIENPRAYIDSNIIGTFNLLEALRARPCRHLLAASTSSVYGANKQQPFEEGHSTDQPVSLYAATKKATEAIAYSYAQLFRIPTTMMRLFTVYGPWGRPDMALFKFTESIIAGTPIEVYGAGKMTRDFTYVDDVVEAIVRLIHRPPQGDPAWSGADPDPASSAAPWKIYNIGNNRPEELMHVVALLEKEFGRTAIKEMLPMQPGDVPATYADIEDLARDVGFQPATSIEDGIARFSKWFREYHKA